MSNPSPIDAVEGRVRARRQQWVEGVRRLGGKAYSQMATPTSLAMGVGAGFMLERAGRHPVRFLRQLRDLKMTWWSFVRSTPTEAAVDDAGGMSGKTR